ncbi:MAG: LDL receptor domain-containing protein [Myxococcales bacterium]|nr:LDL receptor domain-containing protein [Myxococcales bacterium]
MVHRLSCSVVALLVLGCEDDAPEQDPVERYIARVEAVQEALCDCDRCDGRDAQACAQEVLRALESPPEPVLECQAEWLETVLRCLDAAECLDEEVDLCAQPLARLAQLCDAWPDDVAQELRVCSMPDGVCGRQDAGCDPVIAPQTDAVIFTCEDGARVPWVFRCDFREDCADASDERDCDAVRFECADGSAIPRDWRCDLEGDCADESDELGCPAPFTCADGRELPDSWVCDGVEDCAAGEDELSC